MREEPDTMEPSTEEQLAYYQRRVSELEIKILAAERLADEAAALVTLRQLGSRSPLADALLDYRENPQTDRSDRLAALESTIAALRSQIVEWREGGARGADISALDGMLQIVAASRPSGMDLFIEVLTIHRGKEVLFSDSSGDYYNWTWERIDWFCHRSDFPLPVVPRT